MRLLQSFIRRRVFFSFAIATLTSSVGANLVVFTIVNALWLRPSPLPDRDRLVMVLGDASNSGSGDSFAFAELGIQIELRDSDAFEAVAGQVLTSGAHSSFLPRIHLGQIGRIPETLAVTHEYFSVLGLKIRGRDFTRDDDLYGAEPVAIISDRLWKNSFRSEPGIIGQVVPATPLPVRIVGVAPAGFEGARLGEHAEMWIPRNLDPRVSAIGEDRIPQGSAPLVAIARLRGCIAPLEAERMVAQHNAVRKRSMGFHLYVVPLTSIFGAPDSRTIIIRDQNVFRMVAVPAGLVLLAGCTTLMALILAHYERRRQELSVRLALGASRMRLIAQLALELAWIVVGGSAGAIILAAGGLSILPALQLPGGVDLSRLDLSIDWLVALVGIGTAVLTLFIAVSLPILRFTRADLARNLVSAHTTGTASSHRIRRALLGVHVAATLMVLVAAGLFVQSVVYGFTRAPGFNVDGTLFVDVHVSAPYSRSREGDLARVALRAAAELRLIGRLASLPGVRSVALGAAPIGPDQARQLLNPRSMTTESGSRNIRLSRNSVGSGFLSALGVPILAGRPLTDADAGAKPVPAIITASCAHLLWPDGNAIGREFSMGSYKCIVVGITADVAHGSVMLPHSPAIWTATTIDLAARNYQLLLAMRADSPEVQIEPVRRAVADIFPDAGRVDIETGRQVIARDLGRERLGAWFFSGFGLVSLTLGIAGVFGLVAYVVESRRRDFGIRIALGATPGHLIRRAVSTGLWPVVIGAAVGLGLAALLARVAASFLAGMGLFDPLIYFGAATLMAACAAAAGHLAAWRVQRISPADALRAE